MALWWHATGLSAATIGQSGVATPSTLAVVAAVPAPTAKGTSVAQLDPATALIATALSGTQIGLTWDPPVWAAHFDIERDGVIVASDQTVVGYLDDGLTPGITYTYRVRSKP